MRLLWLPEVLRAAGLTVHEVSGWRTRGSDSYTPRGLICHATAGSPKSTDAGEIRVLLEGSTSAPPPIAQLYLSRSGAWHVVASGRCNHARTGWGGPLEGLGNSSLIGVEAQNDNRGQAWPSAQLDAYQRGAAAICRRMGWGAGTVAAHREHQPGAKSDPHGIDMTKFRARVAALLDGEQEEDMPSVTEIWAARWGSETARETAGDRLAMAAHSARDALAEVRSLRTAVTALAEARPGVDTGAILTRMDALAAEERERDARAAAERAELAELVRRVDAGEIDAAEVVRLIGEQLTAATTPQG
ncbi:N-acetylmuramoyl-L-alanine amidase [Micromonospora peucetia]|uniref:N-acetylmuramoyl-L-alanine amidase n=1 Tax=Micromonospora peucetia TaxID=47871 RepID=A0ABZ1EJW3_9ACTN|nr:N-acetylmuramoyl-L-alanine amidase [Micromonospora peucetia]WSA34559.1 N-acetylmuramoyl-L-alanine amidase [Micromonospora peucetia]